MAAVRLKVLRLLQKSRHRYDVWRAVSQTASLGVLFLVPLTGLARVDVWGGRHFLLLRDATWKHALAGVIVGISAMYVLTFLSNVVGGRLFCGWGCPVGQVSRFGDAASMPGLTRGRRLWRQTLGVCFGAAFVLSMMAWWVDLRVLWRGEGAALGWAWAALIVGIAGAWAHGRWWRWEFCKQACPIGIYYTFVSPAKWFGVHFRNEHDTCIECQACDHVCPVNLLPRELMKPMPARGGASVSDAPGRNHCLECGDCIRACEKMIELKGVPPIPLRIGYYRGPQRREREAGEASHSQVSSANALTAAGDPRGDV
jgi:ferredoxin-type protein NapH